MRWTSLIAVTALLALPVAATAQTRVATVTKLDGEARALTEAGERPLALRDPIFENDRITTSADGGLGIVFRDDTLFTLGPGADATIDSFIFDPRADALDFAIDLRRGVFAYVSGNIAKLRPQAVNLKTSIAVLGVRGTQILGAVADPRVYALSRNANAPIESLGGPVRSQFAFDYFGGDNIFVLVPDPDGTIGAVELRSTDGGAPVALTQANAATRIADGRLLAPFTADADVLDRAFAILEPLRPDAPARFILYFESGTTQLAAASAGLLDDAAAEAAAKAESDLRGAA